MSKFSFKAKEKLSTVMTGRASQLMHGGRGPPADLL